MTKEQKQELVLLLEEIEGVIKRYDTFRESSPNYPSVQEVNELKERIKNMLSIAYN